MKIDNIPEDIRSQYTSCYATSAYTGHNVQELFLQIARDGLAAAEKKEAELSLQIAQDGLAAREKKEAELPLQIAQDGLAAAEKKEAELLRSRVISTTTKKASDTSPPQSISTHGIRDQMESSLIHIADLHIKLPYAVTP